MTFMEQMRDAVDHGWEAVVQHAPALASLRGMFPLASSEADARWSPDLHDADVFFAAEFRPDHVYPVYADLAGKYGEMSGTYEITLIKVSPHSGVMVNAIRIGKKGQRVGHSGSSRFGEWSNARTSL